MIKIEENTIKNNTEQAKQDIQKAIELALTEVAMLIEGSAVKLCPVNENRLRGSITYSISNKAIKDEVRSPAGGEDGVDEEHEFNEAIVGTNVNYAEVVEFGSKPHFPPIGPLKDWARKVLGDEAAAYAVAKKISRQGTKAQPFLRPAVDNNLEKIKEMFSKRMGEAVNASN